MTARTPGTKRAEPSGRRARTRAALLTSAAELFAERGYDAASLDDIAARAGFTRGALYASFADKEDLLLSLLAETTEAWLTELADAFAGLGTDVDRGALDDSAAMWDSFVEAHSQRLLLLAECRVQAARRPSVAARVAELDALLTAALAEVVRGQEQAGLLTLRLPPERHAALMIATAQGLVLAHLVDGRRGGETLADALRLATSAHSPGGRKGAE
ncbi:TetR family transcriptional regulator [Nocardioides acrostichi]|uniref:TetR/AcrR family transcriptional regulator n=1 Tax=Nocardioides acrostichi TaxID=2784339 RepID=A0A930Y6Q7_9ACTN|nr:TetR/AcrR family transcriptional regulator [Nocardioides acrostichi]MBF4161242.1 TetR/AcrR family transcriptional regulator [Nocardioides acrostichi]